MECIRREQDEAEVRECSFRPQINSKSARMVEQRQQILRVRGAVLPEEEGWWPAVWPCSGRTCLCG